MTTPERSPCGHRVAGLLDLAQQAELLELGDDRLARREAVEAAIARPARSSFSRASGVEDVDHRQAVALADLEVVEVVRRGDLHRAGALLRVGVLVGDDRDQPVGDAAGAPCLPTRSL